MQQMHSAYTCWVDSGQIVREARRRAGISQRTLASRVGMSQPSIARIERGDVQPSFDRTLGLVRACGFDLEIHVVPLDEDAWTLAERGAAVDPAARLDRMLAGTELLEEGMRARGDAGG